MILAVYYFRLEISVPTAGSIYFSSGTSDKSVVLVESTMLLPLLFVAVAALFVTMAQRMGKRDGGAAAVARLHAQHCSAASPA